MTTETMEVELLDGTIVEDVPVNWSKAQIYDQLRKNNQITDEQFAEWTSGVGPVTNVNDPRAQETPASAKQEMPEWLQGVLNIPEKLTEYPPELNRGPMTAEDAAAADARVAEIPGQLAAVPGNIMDWTQDNLDIPGAMAGGYGGAAAGSLFGPVGSFVGGVGGAALGSFGGDLASDWLRGDDLDYDDATKNALLGVGMDVVTLGTMRAFKAARRALGYGDDEIADLWQKHAARQETIHGPPSPFPAPVGSPKSLIETQLMLQKADAEAGLTAYQTGKAGGKRRFAENLGELGILSSGGYQTRATKNANAISSNIDALINDSMGELGGNNLGETVHGIIQSGREAAQYAYNHNMGEVLVKAGNMPIPTGALRASIVRFLKEGETAFGSSYDDATVKLANQWIDAFTDIKQMPLKDLVAFQKKLNATINTMSDFGATQNTVAAQQLASMSSDVREMVGKIIRGKDAETYKVYSEINRDYGEAMEGLLPKINANVVTNADKKNYESLARVLEGKNPDQIEAFMKSIDEAYAQVGEAGLEESINKMTREEAIRAIRSGWLKNIFGESVTDGFDPKKFANLAATYEKPSNQRAARAVLGADWPTFKRLLNAMSAVSAKDTSQGFGSLVLRAKEAQGAMAGAQAAAAVLSLGAVPFTGGAALVGAPAILLSPIFLAKAASNPAAVNRLLSGLPVAQMTVREGASQAASAVAMNRLLEGVMSEMSEEDQAEIRNYFR